MCGIEFLGQANWGARTSFSGLRELNNSRLGQPPWVCWIFWALAEFLREWWWCFLFAVCVRVLYTILLLVCRHPLNQQSFYCTFISWYPGDPGLFELRVLNMCFGILWSIYANVTRLPIFGYGLLFYRHFCSRGPYNTSISGGSRTKLPTSLIITWTKSKACRSGSAETCAVCIINTCKKVDKDTCSCLRTDQINDNVIEWATCG